MNKTNNKLSIKLRPYKAHSDTYNLKQMILPYEYREKFFNVAHKVGAETMEEAIMILIDKELERK